VKNFCRRGGPLPIFMSTGAGGSCSHSFVPQLSIDAEDEGGGVLVEQAGSMVTGGPVRPTRSGSSALSNAKGESDRGSRGHSDLLDHCGRRQAAGGPVVGHKEGRATGSPFAGRGRWPRLGRRAGRSSGLRMASGVQTPVRTPSPGSRSPPRFQDGRLSIRSAPVRPGT